MSHDTLGIELLVQCDSCGAQQPVNGPFTTQRCSNCLTDFTIDDVVWRGVLSGVVELFAQTGRGVTEHGRVDRAGRDAEWERGPALVPCEACDQKAEYTPEGLVCRGCGTARPLDPAPAFVGAIDPQIAGVVAPAEPSPEPPKKLATGCVSCGAALTIDDTTPRTHTCTYCDTTNILTDDVWRALHPPKQRRRWWLAYRLAEDPRRRQPAADPPAAQIVGLAIFSVVGSVFLGGGLHALVSPDTMREFYTSLPYILPVFAILAIGSCAFVLLRHFRKTSCVTADNEVIGRLASWTGGKAAVDLVDPRDHRELAKGTLSITQDGYTKLGGAGGLVRAWRNPKTGWVEVGSQVSTLGDRRRPLGH